MLPLDWRIPLEAGQSLSVIAVFPLVIALPRSRDHPSNRPRARADAEEDDERATARRCVNMAHSR